MSKKIEALEQRIIDLMNQRNGLEVETERLHGVLKKKNEHISRLEADVKEGKDEFQKQKEMHSRIVKQLQAEIKKISEHKDTMILSVDIVGGEDIDEMLDDAEKTMVSRLAKKGLKDKYILLAKPDTIGIEIHR